ncbi:eCIS core domain-containing protein [Ulvibacter antarcticus]|uniref:Outer membrane protein OmpA-like peptidoglycan-associated protein n=1 Tax=Ulvibacter antarcticus TaxID=442714 RepID=A0A3L9YWL2_9FLAO|nr:DUF4157 domain-containing protein [Ulvibacter antarcticus]RMA58862.1 outer membrane protein OmpA-like peptidoglycan-associated protein [Ulvibacter antarcticus]
MKKFRKKKQDLNVVKDSTGTFFPPIQKKAEITKPVSSLELEADMAAQDVVINGKNSAGIHKHSANNESATSVTPKLENLLSKSKGRGQNLDSGVRSQMESRFGADFGSVKVHKDSNAISMNKQLRAQAFTNGHDIFFNSGKYNPSSKSGKKLIAHELTHTIQQGASGNQIQRKLSVESKYPQDYINDVQPNKKGTDPSIGLPDKSRLDLVKSQLGKISPEFKVDGSGNVKKSHNKSEAELADGKKGTGNCCLHVLTRPKSKTNWRLLVADHLAPHTNEEQKVVLINTNLNPLTFGFHTKTGKKIVYKNNPEIILGHELCGHASLLEVGLHAEGSRKSSNVHDSTVKIENEIAKSLGKKDDELRGLAGDGKQKGESFGQGVVINFGFNKTDVNKLDSSEKEKLKLISDIVKRHSFFVELKGHSDNVGSESAKQNVSDRRAKSVFLFLRKLGVSLNIKVPVENERDFSANRWLLKGMSDKEPLKQFDPVTEQHKLRRVDVVVAASPASLSEFPSGISKANQKKINDFTIVDEPDNVKKFADQGDGTACEILLAKKAYR